MTGILREYRPAVDALLRLMHAKDAHSRLNSEDLRGLEGEARREAFSKIQGSASFHLRY
jgi:hypothetical protein